MSNAPISRRTVLRATGAAGLLLSGACTPEDPAPGGSSVAADPGAPTASAGPSGSASPSGTPASANPPSTGSSALTPAMFEDLATCPMTPAAATGPFPNRQELVRSDITEGRPGHPVQLGLRVLGPDCQPVPDARVVVWHTDHTGDYSSYIDGGSGKDEGDDSTFLRGVQVADADGIVTFITVFPGWYDGRAVHIHVMVGTPDGRDLTTQLYFDDAVTAQILAEGVYAEFGQPDTSVSADGLAGDVLANGTQLTAIPIGEATRALINVGLA